jgi:hypothetical protein
MVTFLPRRVIEFDPVEAIVGVALRGHPIGLRHVILTFGGRV